MMLGVDLGQQKAGISPLPHDGLERPCEFCLAGRMADKHAQGKGKEVAKPVLSEKSVCSFSAAA